MVKIFKKWGKNWRIEYFAKLLERFGGFLVKKYFSKLKDSFTVYNKLEKNFFRVYIQSINTFYE